MLYTHPNPCPQEGPATLTTASFDLPHFDLDLIADSGQTFRWIELASQHYRIPADGRICEVSQTGTSLTLCCEAADEPFWHHYLTLDEDYGSYVERLCQSCPTLDMMVRATDGIRVLHQPLFETVVAFMTSQNNNIGRIKGSMLRMCGAPEAPFPAPDLLAATLAVDDCGLGYRRDEIRDMAIDWNRLESRLGQGFEQDRTTLQTVRGIGPKVADCICLFGLEYACAWPVDTWMRKAQERYDLPLIEGLEGIEQQFVFTWMRMQAQR